jgi:hypothetical protein
VTTPATGPALAPAPFPAAPDWRWALPRIAALFVLSRALIVLLAVLVETRLPPLPPAFRWTDAPILTSLTVWDSRYYLGIAASGYHAAPVFGPWVDYVFFPLYPMTVRLASFATLGNVDLAGVLVANLFFGLALVVLYALSVRHLPRDPAFLSLAFLTVAPGATAFAMAYSESLFLLLSAACFLAAERRRVAVSGVLFALVTLTRAPGILVGLPLLMLLLRDPAVPRRSLAWLTLGPLALVGFSAYVGVVTGDPIGWIHAQSLWTIDVPPLPAVIWTATIAFHVVLIWFIWRDRTPVAYALVALLPFAAILAANRLTSASRYLAVAWPYDWSLARRPPWVRLAILTALTLLQCVTTVLIFSGHLIA